MKRFFRFLFIFVVVLSVLSLTVFAEDPEAQSSDAPYFSIYDLVDTYIFGGTVVEGSYEDLVCIFLSSMFSIGLIVLPFLAVVWFIRRIC